jgi:hypothetical protein
MNDVTNISKKGTDLKTLRMAARVIGAIWIVICLFAFISFFLEGTPKNADTAPKPPDILGIATIICFIIGFCGLIIAWWREGIGGFLSLFGFILTGVLFKLNPNFIFSYIFFIILLLPSVLYLMYWWGVKNKL